MVMASQTTDVPVTDATTAALTDAPTDAAPEPVNVGDVTIQDLYNTIPEKLEFSIDASAL